MTAATPGQAAPVSDWWVCDGPLTAGGKKIIGPFATQELALGVRAYVEKAGQRTDLWVDDEPAAQQTQPAPGAQCGTCDGSGMLTVPDGDGESASEQACPDPVHDGDDWFEVGDADAGTQPAPELAAAMAEARTLRTDLDEATRVMLAHHDGAVQRRGRALRKRAGLEEL